MINCKPLNLFFIFVFSTFYINSIAQDGCRNLSASSQFFTANDVKAIIRNRGSLFHGDEDGNTGFSPTAPILPDGIQTIYAAGIWAGGMDENGNIGMAAMTYNWNNNGYDYWPGPINEEGFVNSITCDNFNHIWKVNGKEILALREFVKNNLPTTFRINNDIPFG